MKKVLGPPLWARDTYMHLLVEYGGQDCLHLPYRLHVCMLQTYLAASHSRNELAVAAAQYLATAATPLFEGHLHASIQPMGLLL